MGPAVGEDDLREHILRSNCMKPRLWAVCFLVLASFTGCMLGKGKPSYHGKISGNPVSAPVQILRDGQGVPHIYAEDAPDLFFGLGYAMAQDRLFQMDLYRYTASGRLSEIFGNLGLGKGVKLVQLDMPLRCFELREHALDAVGGIPPERRILLERFVTGINQLIQDMGDGVPSAYRLMRWKPEPWAPADVLAIAELFGIGLGAINIQTEVLRYSMGHVIGKELADDFFVRYAGLGGYEPPGQGSQEVLPDPSSSLEPSDLFRCIAFLRRGMPQGSNNWVVSGHRTPSGLPLLANDPHVPLGIAPSFWYHAHLHGGGLSVGGLVLPGYPAFGAGWNGQVAWGITNVMADQIDMIRVGMDPERPDQYETEQGWGRFETSSLQRR
jgi:penicillin amidase